MDNPYEGLERIFHEPSRLAIMTELCGTDEGRTFGDLKKACNLSDGNLSRHLKTLEDAGAIKIHKEFVESKPRTTVFVSAKGRKSFLDYLNALEEVLRDAAQRAKAVTEGARGATAGKLKPSKA